MVTQVLSSETTSYWLMNPSRNILSKHMHTHTHTFVIQVICVFFFITINRDYERGIKLHYKLLYQKNNLLSNCRLHQPTDFHSVYLGKTSVNMVPFAILGHKCSRLFNPGWLPSLYGYPPSSVSFCLSSVFICFVSCIAFFFSQYSFFFCYSTSSWESMRAKFLHVWKCLYSMLSFDW